MIIPSAGDQRNTYQEKPPLGAKICVATLVMPPDISTRVLSVGDSTKTILAGPSVVGKTMGANVGCIRTTDIS